MGKKELRRLARLQRRAEETARQEHSRRRTRGIIAAASVLVVGVIAWVVWGAVRPPSTATTAGVAGQPRPPVTNYPELGREHIFPGQAHPDYNSNPPTSGWHFPQPADWGYYNGELPDELVVHNLEHGGIWISFKSADDTEVINKLVALARRDRKSTRLNSSHSPISYAVFCLTKKKETQSAMGASKTLNDCLLPVTLDVCLTSTSRSSLLSISSRVSAFTLAEHHHNTS